MRGEQLKRGSFGGLPLLSGVAASSVGGSVEDGWTGALCGSRSKEVKDEGKDGKEVGRVLERKQVGKKRERKMEKQQRRLSRCAKKDAVGDSGSKLA